MKIYLTIMLAYLAVCGISIGQETDEAVEESPPPVLLREGFVYKGVSGLITFDEDSDKWSFAADSDVNDTRKTITAGTKIELLKTGTLEQLADYAEKNEPPLAVRLWAKVTRYEDRNYLFAVYFITMSGKVSDESVDKATEPESQVEEVAGDPNESSIIPANIMRMLKPKRVVSLSKMREVIQTEGNVVLVGRTGFVTVRNGVKTFEIDALGRKINGASFGLLPCEALQRTEYTMSGSLSRQRYRVAGEVTRYKGKYYILLQRAVRTYSHGNFVR